MAEPSVAEHHALLGVELLSQDGTAILQYSPTSDASEIKVRKSGKKVFVREGLSFILHPHFPSNMYGYLQFKILRSDPSWQPPSKNWLIGSLIVFLKDIKGIGYDLIDTKNARAELARIDKKVDPTSGCLKLVITTHQMHVDVTNHKHMGNLSGIAKFREIISFGNVIAGLIKMEIFIPIETDNTRNEALSLCHSLETGVKADKSKKAKKWPLSPWFAGANSDSRRLLFDNVPRLGKDFPRTPPQKALACFVDLEQYIVTHAVGAVNEHFSASGLRRKGSFLQLEARIFNHSKYSIGANQFFLLIRSQDDNDAAQKHDKGSVEPAMRKQCKVKLVVGEAGQENRAIQSLPGALDKNSCQNDGDHQARPRQHLWWLARRFDNAIPNIPNDSLVYIVDFPRDVDQEDRELPLDTIEGDCNSFEELMNHSKQRNLKVQMRTIESDQCISAEMGALERLTYSTGLSLPNPPSFRAFEYLMDFARRPDTPVVDLLKRLPGLRKLAYQTSWEAFPPALHQLVTQSVTKRGMKFIKSLSEVEASLSFVTHDDETDTADFVLCLIAGATLGVERGQCPSLYVSAANKNLDEFAEKAGRLFESLYAGMRNPPGVLRLSNRDADFAHSSPSESMRPLKLGEDAINTAAKIENDDIVREFLSQFGLHTTAESRQAIRAHVPGTLTIHEAAYRHYLMESKRRFSKIEELVSKLRSTGELDHGDSMKLRGLVKNLYADMLKDFKGIVCTTPALAAHEWVRNFDPTIVFMGEARQIRELSSLIPIAHYMPDAWMFFGNMDGRRPYVADEAKKTENPFLDQLSVSLFERAVRCGKSSGRL